MVTNPKIFANIFNNYFRRKIQLLREKTNQPPTIPPSERLRKWLAQRDHPPPTFKLKIIDKLMFRKIMNKMKPKRVHGVDFIDSFSLKVASPLMEDALIHLINLSILESKFSTRWKPQLIFPLHKKNEKDVVGNYRPVSHLVQVGKMVEYALYFQIVEHFITNNLFHPNHHGSLANHSTATAIIQLFDMCLEAADNGELSALCLLDQSAAYDLLCHHTLREKLHLYNFCDSSIEWLMSYLGGRTQLVQVESRTSSELECDDSGVPQGSVLGGLLHVINSNDFPACHEEGEAVVYVDDDSDFAKDREPARLYEKIQAEAENSAQWLRDNRLCVAGEKSKLLVLGTGEMRTSKLINGEMQIVVDGKQITESSSEKLLGLVLNSKLTWKNHLYGDRDHTGLIPQLNKRLGMLKRLSKFMSKEKLQYFSSGIFYSKLSYCLPVFGNIFGLDKYKEENRKYFSFTVKDNQNLQVIQNKLNKLLLNADHNTPTAELLHRSGSLSVHQMIAYQTAVTTYKIVKSGKPSYIASKMKVRQTNQNTRLGESTLQVPKYKLNIAREGFIFRGASIYNKLDECLRSEPKLERFKTGVRDWIKINITIKPTPSFPSISLGNRRHQPPPPPEPPPRLNSIRRYLVPLEAVPTSTSTRESSTSSMTSTLCQSRSSRKNTIQDYFKPVSCLLPVATPVDDQIS